MGRALLRRAREQRGAAGALLGVLGLLLNAFPVALSPGIDWLFGGIAYLLAAVTLGPGPGLLAAGLASARTLWLWQHPWALVTFGAEALVIGYLVTRGQRRPLVAAALYWLLLGVPLILLTYRGLMGMTGTTLAIVLLKQPLNGLVNAVAVEALLLLPGVRRALRVPHAPRLRDALAVVLMVAAIVPALVFGVWAGRREWSRSVALAHERVEIAARSYAAKLEQYVGLHQQAVRALASAIESRPDLSRERLQRLLAAEHEEFPGFLNLYVADSRGVTLAFQPPHGPGGESLVGLDFSDRPYFQQLRTARRTIVSEVFAGRGGADRPLVVITHPIVLADTFAGYVLGALDLGALPKPVVADTRDQRLWVLDAGGRIVFDTDDPYDAGDTVRTVPWAAVFERIRADDGPGITAYRPDAPPAVASRVAAQMLVGYAPLAALEWWTWVEHPFRQVEAAVAAPYARLLGLLVALFLAGGVLSTLLAGWLAAPLLRVRQAAAALAAGERHVRVGELAGGAPREIAELGRGFDEMAAALADRAEELEELSEITRSLASTLESPALLRQITDATLRLLEPDGCGIALLDAERPVLRAEDYTLGLLAPTAGREIPVDGSLIGWVVRHRQAVLVSEPEADPRIYRAAIDVARLGSILCAPLVGRSGPLGTLTAVRARTHRRPFTHDDLRLLERLAGAAAIAVENARLLEAAQAASRAKSDFLAAMSHELRTPLNAVLGHLELLELQIHGPLAPQQREALGRIGAATRHLRGLIEEVLSFARLEAGRAEVHFARVDVCEIVEEVAAVMEPLAREKQLGFEVERCARPVWTRTDPDKVRQILINLAGNALKFTEAGEVRLAVEAGGDGGAGDEGGVVLRVIDTGPGIAPRDRARLFRPFEQLHSGLARRHGGTGLGLYLSGQYAALIGARIEVQSEPGRGSVFSLVLPPPDPEEEAGSRAARSRSGAREPGE